MKKKKPTQRLRMWAVCYPDADSSVGWTPYSGDLYHFRKDAEEKASGTTNAIMSVLVQPTGYVRRSDSASGEQT